MMESSDFEVLTRLQSLKVGDMQKAIEGVDPMVRLMDVPAVVDILNSEKKRRQAFNREI